jgi:hypothetical protein
MEIFPMSKRLNIGQVGFLATISGPKTLTTKKILSKFPIEKFKKAYPTFHECNKNRMIEYMDEVIGV